MPNLSDFLYAEILGAALSLHASAEAAANAENANLWACYEGGGIGFMQHVLRVADEFCSWADENVDFTDSDEVWPYLLHDKFGPAVLSVIDQYRLYEIGQSHFPEIAEKLGMKLKL
jgi:hypothetical protein